MRAWWWSLYGANTNRSMEDAAAMGGLAFGQLLELVGPETLAEQPDGPDDAPAGGGVD